MKEYNWLAHWENNDIPFHQSTINPLLQKYWSQLGLSKVCHVLVPLCGKTSDLLWLANQGHHVIGVELSEIACEAFFVENNLPFKKKKKNNFICYYNHQIELYCGDFFTLSSDMLPPITAVYDRAALIAFPDKLRQRYANHLIKLMALNSQMLLIVYDAIDSVEGPPYPVPFEEIKKLFEKQFQIFELARIQKIDLPLHLCEKGYHETYEAVYCLSEFS